MEKEMTNLYYITNSRRVYQITRNEDGRLNFYPHNPNAGNVIMSRGGIDKFIGHCIEDARNYDEFAAHVEAEQEKKRLAGIIRSIEIKENEEKEYNDLLAKYPECVPATSENLCIIMRHLCNINWGMWNLPKLSQGYKANQYDCGGKTAVTITLEIGIESEGVIYRKLQCGAPFGHLTNYTNIERL